MAATLSQLADPTYRERKGPRCTMHLVLEQLDADQAKLVQLAMANQHASSAAISAALRDMGHYVKAPTLHRHRRGECACPR